MKTLATNVPSDKSLTQGSESENGLQAQLAEKMIGLFDLVISERSKYYSQHPDKTPSRESTAWIIKSYSNKNAAISGGLSLIPGPWGMAAAIPEIALVIRNQLAMIYDIGMAHGKEKVLTKELLVGVLVNTLATGGGVLLVMHGGKIVVRRVALRVFQRIINLLAGKVTQQLLKSMISKWLPVVGAVAMATWSNYATRRIGEKATEILEKDIEIASEVAEELPDSSLQCSERSTATNLDALRIQALFNLMKVDGKLKPKEYEFLQTFVAKTNLAEADKANLLNRIKDPNTKFNIDYTAFNASPEDALSLLIDLVALAKIDGEFQILEKMHIKQIGKLMGFGENDIEEAMAIGQD